MTSTVVDQGTAIVEQDLSVHLHETCDRCGSRAYVKATMGDRLPLAFCNHHYDRHAESLHAVAFKISDGRQALEG